MTSLIGHGHLHSAWPPAFLPYDQRDYARNVDDTCIIFAYYSSMSMHYCQQGAVHPTVYVVPCRDDFNDDATPPKL